MMNGSTLMDKKNDQQLTITNSTLLITLLMIFIYTIPIYMDGGQPIVNTVVDVSCMAASGSLTIVVP